MGCGPSKEGQVIVTEHSKDLRCPSNIAPATGTSDVNSATVRRDAMVFCIGISATFACRLNLIV
jgi:hypothetical protein